MTTDVAARSASIFFLNLFFCEGDPCMATATCGFISLAILNAFLGEHVGEGSPVGTNATSDGNFFKET